MKRHDESAPDRLRRMAASDENLVGRGRAEQIASRAMARASTRAPRYRAVAVVASSAFAIVAVTGVGAVADRAVPGEALYAIDRAYESVGRVIGGSSDRTEETIAEARILFDRGQRDLALDHIVAELQSVDASDTAQPSPEAAEALPSSEPVADQGAAVASDATEAGVQPGVDANAETTDETVDASEDAEAADPLNLAIDFALRALAEAQESEDAEALVVAAEAVDSLVKLAAEEADGPDGSADTTAEADLEPIEIDDNVDDGAPADELEPDDESTGDSQDPDDADEGPVDSTTTTTTVSDDSEGADPTGDGDDPTGEDQGDGQEDPGDSEEPEDTEPGSGPIVLPFP